MMTPFCCGKTVCNNKETMQFKLKNCIVSL